MSEDLLIYGVLGFVSSDSSCKFINQNNIFKITFLKFRSCNNAPITCKMMLEIIPTTFIPRRIQISLFLIENNLSAQQKNLTNADLVSVRCCWCRWGAGTPWPGRGWRLSLHHGQKRTAAGSGVKDAFN